VGGAWGGVVEVVEETGVPCPPDAAAAGLIVDDCDEQAGSRTSTTAVAIRHRPLPPCAVRMEVTVPVRDPVRTSARPAT